MNSLSLKQKITGLVVIIGAALIMIFQGGFYPKNSVSKQAPEEVKIQANQPELISTNPSPLDKAIIWGMQPVEITFNLPLENIPEIKYKWEPKTDLKAELSSDKKTVKFMPVAPLPLGTEFVLSIPKEAKFEGGKTLGKSYSFRFKTIEYRGI